MREMIRYAAPRRWLIIGAQTDVLYIVYSDSREGHVMCREQNAIGLHVMATLVSDAANLLQLLLRATFYFYLC